MHPINFSPIYPHKTPCRWGNNVVCGGIKIESAACKIDNGICNVVNDTYLIIYGINEIVFGKNNDDFDIHEIIDGRKEIEYGKMKFVGGETWILR